MTGEDRTLIENEGVNAASGDEQSASPGDVLGPVEESAAQRTEEQPEPGDVVGAPEQIPGMPGQQLEAGEGGSGNT
jgi:hypothetical protein